MFIKSILRHEFIFIFFAAFFSALSSFLLKIGGGKINGDSKLMWVAAFPYLAALISYALGFISYSIALRTASVYQAYPVMVGMTIFLIFSWNIFSGIEQMTIRGYIGTAILIFGVYLILSSGSE